MYEFAIKANDENELFNQLAGLCRKFGIIPAAQPLRTEPTRTEQTTAAPQQKQAPTEQQQQVAPQPMQQVAPQQQPAQRAIPTTDIAQGFSLEQIQRAMGGMRDAGKMDTLMRIMAEFGVKSVGELSKDSYPAVVMRLREEGAQI